MTSWTPSGSLVDANGNSLLFVPSAGGYQLPITPLPDVLLTDNFNGTVIDTVNRWQSPVLAGAGTMTQAGGPGMGNGILSATANNVLTATGAASQTLSGYLIGTEE